MTKRNMPRALLLALATLTVSACTVSRQPYLVERDRRITEEARAKKFEWQREDLRLRVASMENDLSQRPERMKRVRLEARTAALRRGIREARVDLERCRQDTVAGTRPKPWVRLAQTQIWDSKHHNFRTLVRQLIERRRPRLEHCYRLHGWDSEGGAPVRGAFWVLFGLGDGWPFDPKISTSTFGDLSKSSGLSAEHKRASKLHACVRQVFAKLRASKEKSRDWWQLRSSVLRVSQLLVFADTKRSARTIKSPKFSWPWPSAAPKGKRAKRGEVCGYGEMRRRDLYPHFNLPCATGLKCCYPCGTRGCDSICLPRCPRNLP
jgi:hypothetical protein